MATRRKSIVVDQTGARGRIREFVVDDAGVAVVIVELRGGAHVAVPTELLHLQEGGGYAIDAHWGDFSAPERLDVPVVAEEVSVGVRKVPRERLRIRQRVVIEDQVVDTHLVQERIDIERVPRDELVDRMPDPRREGETLIIPCVEEVVVVEKRLRLREELHVRVVRERHTDRRTIPVRRHQLEIEREAESASPDLAANNPNKQQGGTS